VRLSTVSRLQCLTWTERLSGSHRSCGPDLAAAVLTPSIGIIELIVMTPITRIIEFFGLTHTTIPLDF
jgi:hypothetical protein